LNAETVDGFCMCYR